MTSFSHQNNLCKLGYSRSEIRLAIMSCKRRTEFAPQYDRGVEDELIFLALFGAKLYGESNPSPLS